MARKYLAAGCILLSLAAGAFGEEPAFDYLRVGADAEGFITLSENGGPAERFFPLGTFFYPSPPEELDNIVSPEVAYHDFAYMGGNLVVAPWDPAHWPYRPGALFDDYGTATGHLNAAHNNGVLLLADPALFWGKAGAWNDDGTVVGDGQRQTWFDELVTRVNNTGTGDCFMGYYQWDQPAWRYYDSRTRLPAPRPSPSYITNAAAYVETLEAGAGADHAIYMAQGDAVKVRDFWPDYYEGADISGALVLPYPAPAVLEAANEMPDSPKHNCLLPNYYASVSGSLADATFEAARAPVVMPHQVRMGKPYIAVLQAKDQAGETLSEHQMRFQAYDAIIHGAKGLVWYDDNDFVGLSAGHYFYEDSFAQIHSLLAHLSGYEINGALRGDYGQTLVKVTTSQDVGGILAAVEESTFVGGKMVPKTHFLSDQIIMEGVSKEFEDWTYLIVACRAPEGSGASYTVKFRPFFSAYTYDEPWGTGEDPNHLVFKIDIGAGGARWMHVDQAAGGGWWEDTFQPEDVAVYKFQPPAPWQPPAVPPPGG